MSTEKLGGYKTEGKKRIEGRERKTPRNEVNAEQHVRDIRGLREDIGMKTYLHGPMDYAKKLKREFV